MWNLIPDWFNQPLLPGWFSTVITVNDRNSRSPETEREILAEASYGRQLGRLMEAVVVLINQRPAQSSPIPEFEDLLKLEQRIRAIKERSKGARLNRVEADLALLKRESPEEYRRIAGRMAREEPE